MEKTVKNGFMLNWNKVDEMRYTLRIHELALLLYEEDDKLSWKDAIKKAKNFKDNYDFGRDW